MQNTDYGIEWAYGEFRIAKFNSKNECVEAWFAPYEVNDLSDLSRAMYDASKNIDISRGGTLAIAYEDDKHTHEFLEVPDLPKRDLEKYLLRRIEKDKPFEGEAASCYHPVLRNSDNKGVLLHLMPKSIVDAVIRICEEYYLTPKRLVPLTEIMSEHVPKLNANASDILLVVALFNRRAQLLVSHGNGEILFVRELVYSWQHDKTERLVIEINRTIGYIKQRIGPRLENVWIMGEYAPEIIEEFKTRLNAPVELDSSAIDMTFWTQEVANLPQRLSSNFIPVLARRSITRKSVMRTAVLGVSSLVTVAVLATVIIEMIIAKHGINNYTVQQEIARVNQEINQLSNNLEKIEIERQRLNHLSTDAFNLPAVFLSHLGNMVPDGITLTQVNIDRSHEYWEIIIAGTSELRLNELPVILTQLENQLVTSPWNASITQPWQKTWMKQLRSGGATSQAGLGFEIKGHLK